MSEARHAGADRPYRVMVVDDSAIIRGLITRWLSQEPDLEVVASAANGQSALAMVKQADPEVLVLDIEMPEMDGLTALPKLLAARPGLRIVMASTLTRRNAEISLKALELGASDYLAKPESTRSADAAIAFRLELIAKIRALAHGLRARAAAAPAPRAATQGVGLPKPQREPLKLRSASPARPRILLIGSSTGGPQALAAVVGGLKTNRPGLPILVAQHMPATFTAILAEHLGRASGLPSTEGKDGDPVLADHIYVAPGDHHMMIVEANGERRIRLTRDPPENFCRPSVEPLFRTASALYGSACLALMLTGMGSDGLKASRTLVEGGGTLIAQDEASSVVWGMPGAVAQAGLCAQVLPLHEIAPALLRLIGRGAS